MSIIAPCRSISLCAAARSSSLAARFLQRSLPEAALFLVAAPIGQHHGQRDLPLAEIIADGLAHQRLLAGIVERIVDQLKRDTEVPPKEFKCCLFGLGPLGDHRADSAAAANSAAVFAPITCR